MKKLTTLFLLALLPLMASAQTLINGIYYDLNANTKEATVVSGSTKYKGNVTIPKTIKHQRIIYSVTSIGGWAFYGCSGLTEVTIPNSVTWIGPSAFDGTAWYNNQPDGLVYAGKVAYKYKGTMPGSTSVSIKEGTLGINSEAFKDCLGLTSVTIPNSVTTIGYQAFYGCSGLKSVTISNSVTSIGSSAFWGCSGLTSVILPNSVTTIGDAAFLCCSNLTTVKIPNSVTSIGDAAFWGCSKLTSVTIPKSVTSIGDRVFSECSRLKSISVESGNPKYKSRNNRNAIIETATNTIIASCNKTEKDTVIYKANHLEPCVIFKMGKVVIERSQEKNVELIARYANNNKECKILVEGFAYEPDCGAKTQKEWEGFQYMISKKRADNVKKLLVKKHKIDADRIIAKGCGFTDKLFDEVQFNRIVLFRAIPK